MLKDNLLIDGDSYSDSHPYQYPPDANAMYSYIEARKNHLAYQFRVDNVVFFGLQAYIKEYLLKPITLEDIDEAEAFNQLHGEPFNRHAWMKVLTEYNGYLPIRIKAVPEGTRVPIGNVLVTVECDDPDLYWIAGFIEAALVRAVWYPTNVATISRLCRDIIMKYLRITSEDPEGQIPFKLHDFGARGANSRESSGLGGMAHLVNFQGSDTKMGIAYAREYYGEPMAGYSIPAMQHSTVTAWGREHEVEAYRNMIRQFSLKDGQAGKYPVFACVSDSYDIFNATEHIWGEQLRSEVINSGSTLVVRPDSGDPLQVVLKVVKILGDKFGYTTNKRGFKVLKNVRVIQGDGVNPDSINNILLGLLQNGWSAENLAFGMGGALLQKHDRDTFSFAMKCSAIRRGDKWVNVSKDPVTQPEKRSKAGRLALINDQGKLQTVAADGGRPDDLLELVYDHGKLLRNQSFQSVRDNANR